MRVCAAIAAAMAIAACSFAAEPPAHDISVRIDPQARILDGRDTIRFSSLEPAVLLLSARFRLASLSADGASIRPDVSVSRGLQRIRLPAARRVTLHWTGTLAATDTGLDHRGTLTENAPATGPAGTFLPAGSGWYPAVEDRLETYRVTVNLPAGHRGLVPGRLLQERESEGRYEARFQFARPSEGIALMAGPYRIAERQLRTAAGTAVRLRTYFHPEIASLSEGYLDSILGYLDLYERWIGRYPFSEFSVVSSPTPTGFGMPTLTYLGIDVLRLPFIRATSLGHEILHNWWGNGVYPDYANGNWSEGLTTFMADYAYRERDGAQEASAMRLGWLRDFTAIPPGEDQAMARFTSRTHGASQIVGYHKAAMLFLMLRDAIGEAAFDDGVRRFWRAQQFRVAGWAELRSAFEAAAGRNLGTFFEQWLMRAGAPDLRLVDAFADRAGAGWRVSVTLEQGAQAYRLSVPLAVRSATGDTVTRVELARARDTFVIESAQQPLGVALDAEFRVFRRLAASEAPPILRAVMLANDVAMPAISGDAKVRSAALRLAQQLLEQPPRPLGVEERTGSAERLVIGLHAEVDRWLAREGLPPRPAAVAANRGSAQVWMLQDEATRAIAVISASDANALEELLRPLPHYGRQSFIVFQGARAIGQGVWPARPQGREFVQTTGARPPAE